MQRSCFCLACEYSCIPEHLLHAMFQIACRIRLPHTSSSYEILILRPLAILLYQVKNFPGLIEQFNLTCFLILRRLLNLNILIAFGYFLLAVLNNRTALINSKVVKYVLN